jgi:hypothetical protein
MQSEQEIASIGAAVLLPNIIDAIYTVEVTNSLPVMC